MINFMGGLLPAVLRARGKGGKRRAKHWGPAHSVRHIAAAMIRPLSCTNQIGHPATCDGPIRTAIRSHPRHAARPPRRRDAGSATVMPGGIRGVGFDCRRGGARRDRRAIGVQIARSWGRGGVSGSVGRRVRTAVAAIGPSPLEQPLANETVIRSRSGPGVGAIPGGSGAVRMEPKVAKARKRAERSLS